MCESNNLVQVHEKLLNTLAKLKNNGDLKSFTVSNHSYTINFWRGIFIIDLMDNYRSFSAYFNMFDVSLVDDHTKDILKLLFPYFKDDSDFIRVYQLIHRRQAVIDITYPYKLNGAPYRACIERNHCYIRHTLRADIDHTSQKIATLENEEAYIYRWSRKYIKPLKQFFKDYLNKNLTTRDLWLIYQDSYSVHQVETLSDIVRKLRHLIGDTYTIKSRYSRGNLCGYRIAVRGDPSRWMDTWIRFDSSEDPKVYILGYTDDDLYSDITTSFNLFNINHN